jgi:hypothetical protein
MDKSLFVLANLRKCFTVSCSDSRFPQVDGSRHRLGIIAHHRLGWLRLLAFPTRASAARMLVLADHEISRFPSKERPHMPVSKTTPGRLGARVIAPIPGKIRRLSRTRRAVEFLLRSQCHDPVTHESITGRNHAFTHAAAQVR